MTRAPFAPDRTLELAPGERLNFELGGDERAPRSVLWLHGYAATLRNWDDVRPLLPAGFRHVFCDLLGFGFSAKPRGADYSPDGHARRARALMDALGGERWTLVGQSLGGGIALLVALGLVDDGALERLDGLVLIDSAGYPQRLPFFLRYLANPLLGRVVLGLVPPRVQVRVSMRRVYADRATITAERIDRYAFFYGEPGARRAYVEGARQIVPRHHEELLARFREIDVPTLVLWGDRDRIVPVEHGPRFARELPNAHLVRLAGCGHVPQEERPAETAAAIAEHLTATEERPATA